MSLRDSYFNGPSGIQQQMDGAFAAGVAYVGAGATDSSVLELGDRTGANLSRGSGMPGAYFTYATPSANFAMWMCINGQEVAPTVAGATLVQVDLSNSYNGIQVAAAIATAMNAINGEPFAVSTLTNICSLENTVAGVVILPISIGTLDYTYASYTGTIAGTATAVTLTANFVGTGGTSIALAFNGTATIAQAINTWNTANPLNSVTLTSGDGSQVPSNGAPAALTGGNAGTASVSQISPGVAPTGNFAVLASALQSAASQGLTDFRVLVQGTGTGNALYLRYRNGHNQYLGAFFAGIRNALAGENIYDYQCGLTLDISMNSSTNVIFSFHFGSQMKREHVNLEPLTSSAFNPNDLGFDSGVLPI